MINTSRLAKKLANTPHYGAVILCRSSEPLKAHKIGPVQIYLDSQKYYFKYPEDEDIYICIGKLGVCDEFVLKENFSEIISALGLRVAKAGFVSCLSEKERKWLCEFPRSKRRSSGSGKVHKE